jgi:dipeptidyl-peptidase-4
LAIDADARVVYVQAAPDPVVDEVWTVSIDVGRAPSALLVARGQPQWASVTGNFGTGHATIAYAEATPTTLPRFAARSVGGALGTTALAAAPVERELPSVAAPLVAPLLVEITTVGAEATRVAIVRPHGFVTGARAHYPLLDAAYGGPGALVVTASALSYVRAQWMADVTQSIVVAIDARGTPRRGRAWERSLRDGLGATPLAAHVAVIQAVTERVPEVDPARVGIYGWSFGGYLAALAALERPDVFKAAVAGAPPADWRDYDTCYTERYLGMPDTNARAYDDASLLAAAASAHRPNAPLLIVHGTADDNVFFTHSLKLADALTRAGRPFELVPLAGVTHQLFAPDTAGPVWTRMAEFLRDHLSVAEQ